MSTLAGTLSRAADAYVGALGEGLRAEFSLTPFDRVGVPVWATWWRRGRGHVGGIGYGSTEEQARVGALGETAENAFSTTSLPERRLLTASFVELRARVGAGGVLDPRLAGLPAGADYDDDRTLQWLPMHRWGTEEQVLVPADFVASDPADLPGDAPPGGRLATPVTNGLGAGSSVEQAVAHGILEILQRDGNGLTFRALDAGRVLDLDGVDDPGTLEALARLRGAGVEVVAKLAATDLALPNVYVVGCAEDDDLVTATACGEAVHPDRDVALRKAVLEFASARARKRFMHGPLDAVRAFAPRGYLDDALPVLDPATEEPRVLGAMVAWLAMPAERWRPLLDRTVLAHRTTLAFRDLPTSPAPSTSTALVADLQERLGGLDVLVADLTPSGAEGVHAVKVLVPGLEVETIAYGRIGERNTRRLRDAGRDDLVRIGTPGHGEGWARVHLTADAEERLGGPAWVDRRALDALAAGFLPLYREPSRHTAQLVLERRGA